MQTRTSTHVLSYIATETTEPRREVHAQRTYITTNPAEDKKKQHKKKGDGKARQTPPTPGNPTPTLTLPLKHPLGTAQPRLHL